jgi:hypothetical protein
MAGGLEVGQPTGVSVPVFVVIEEICFEVFDADAEGTI